MPPASDDTAPIESAQKVRTNQALKMHMLDSVSAVSAEESLTTKVDLSEKDFETLADTVQRVASNQPFVMAQARLAFENPIISNADMYKASHSGQLPANTTSLYSYCEARKGAILSDIVYFGMQPLLDEMMSFTITRAHIDEASEFFKATFGRDDVFNRAGWEHILSKGGKLPVLVRALPEGTVVEPGTPLFTIESTDPEVPWVVNWLETRLMHIWYTTTVASVAFAQRATLERFLKSEAIADLTMSKMMFCDFGMRGVPNLQAAAAGGMAALTAFSVTDNAAAIFETVKAYPSDLGFAEIGRSIPASEHMTMTIRGRDGELQAFEAMLDRYPLGPISVVSDSYDYDNAVKIFWCEKLVEKVNARYDRAKQIEPDGHHQIVIRPDSGDAKANVVMTLDHIALKYGVQRSNECGSKVFRVVSDKFRVIQGDGINMASYGALLQHLHDCGWSVENLVVGSGGGLLQTVDRDTLRFAIKASAATVDGQEVSIQKETKGKRSKRGRLAVILDEASGKHIVKEEVSSSDDDKNNLLEPVFKDGKRLRLEKFDEIRNKVDAALAKRAKGVQPAA